MIAAIKLIDRVVLQFFRIVSLFLLCVLFALVSTNVILRFFPVFSIGWFDEIVELSFAWMVFTAAAVLWRYRQHPQIDFLEFLLDGTRFKPLLLTAIELVNIAFLTVFTYYSGMLTLTAAATSPIFQIPRKLFYVAMPTAGIYMAIVSLFFLVGHLKSVIHFRKPAQPST